MKSKNAQPSPKGNTRYTLRMPAALLQKLRTRAANSDRSLPGEMINILRQASDKPANAEVLR